MTTLEKGFNSISTRKTFWDNAFVADDMFIHSIEHLHMDLYYILRSNSDGQPTLMPNLYANLCLMAFVLKIRTILLNLNFLCPRTLICQTPKSKRVLFQLIQLGVEQKYTRK